MLRGLSIEILITISTLTLALCIPHPLQTRGQKMFGGYRIAPKICKPTNPGRVKSDVPAVCMFNYECSRRKGEVVGACMDGFLFGACCQLPASHSSNLEKITLPSDSFMNTQEIDHVPDVPILLNPDGTPVDSFITTTNNDFPSTISSNTKDSYENAEKPQIITLNELEKNFSTLLGNEQLLGSLQLPSLISNSESQNQDFHNTFVPVTTLPNPNKVVQLTDSVDQLPSLFSYEMHKSNGTGAETILLNRNGTTLNESFNPDDIFKPSSSNTLEQQNQSIKPWQTDDNNSYVTFTNSPSKQTVVYQEKSSSTKNSNDESSSFDNTIAMSARNESSTKLYDLTTPMSLTTRNTDQSMSSPTVNSNNDTGDKKQDILNREEIAINHIISLLNDTKASTASTQASKSPTTYKWVNSEITSKPTLVKILTTTPLFGTTKSTTKYQSSHSSPNYYHYNTGVTEPSRFASSFYSPSSSYSTRPVNNYQNTNSYTYSTRPTTNPPAPTVIVLGPLNTDYTTVPSQSTSNLYADNSQKLPGSTKLSGSSIRPTTTTKRPDLDTTLTHNISTVISGNKQVLSVSYISVNLKDGTTSKPSGTKISQDASGDTATKKPSTVYTTLTTWSDKPSFHLKPLVENFQWSGDASIDQIINADKVTTKPGFTTQGSNCDEDTAASDDINNFPPVRHPELDSTVTHHQDKPTLVEPGDIISEDEIPTPNFVEDAELNNKVDVFVNKIVESLQGNFQNLKDVVYYPKNVTTPPTGSNKVSKKPISSAITTKRPISTKTTLKATRRPTVTRLPTSQKLSTLKPKATSPGSKKPVTTKRTKPPRRNTTNIENNSEADVTTFTKPMESTTGIPEITPNADFRSICGIRPLVKTGRIVGGKGATFGEWPWQVLVREATWLGLFTKNKCGGVLITDKYVITAAHCQPGFLASLVAVFGEFDISGELESRRSLTRNVRRVIVNRAYDPATFENDLALLELESPIQFDAHIVPICMPDDNADFVNRMATVTGWGRLKYNGGVPSVLQEVKVPIMENSVCQEMFQTAGHSKLILDSFMCAGYANGQKDSCEGDSGGPLTLQRPDGRWILVGTVSHGIKCAAPFLPGVYMRTTYFKPWLHSITGV